MPPSRPLNGQVALVTGASRGIGRALATRLAVEGMSLGLVARSEQALAEVRADLLRAHPDLPITGATADVVDRDAVERAVKQITDEVGLPDLVVNNAGRAESAHSAPWEADPDDWWQTVTTNLRGPMLVTRCVLPAMIARGHGRVVMIGSLRAFRDSPTQTAYAASKLALFRWTSAVNETLTATGDVRAFNYSPGRVATDLTQGVMRLQSSRWTPMDDAVAGIVAIARGELDDLAGRFVHAEDDLAALAAAAADMSTSGGRRAVLSPLGAYDPIATAGTQHDKEPR